MGKKKGGGDDARKAQEAKQKADAAARQAAEQKARQKQQEDDAKRKAQEKAARDRADADRKAKDAKQVQSGKSKGVAGQKVQAAKGKAAAAQQSIKTAAKSVGNTLNKGDIKNLKGQGYSGAQIQQVATRVGNVGQGAQQKLDKVVAKAGGQSGNGISVQAGLQQVGNKLSKGEAKDLKQQGYSLKQIGKIAGQVEAVKPGAEKKLDRWQEKAQKAKEVAAAHRGGSSSGSSTSGSQAIQDLLNTGSTPQTPATPAAPEPGPGISAGGSYGTADRNGWLAAELNAIDTFRPDTTPTLFNSYRPTDLSGQLNDAVSDANSFIDDTASRWRNSSSASVSPTAIKPRSLFEEDEQERYGLAF